MTGDLWTLQLEGPDPLATGQRGLAKRRLREPAAPNDQPILPSGVAVRPRVTESA